MLARHCEDLRVLEIIGRPPGSVRQDIVRARSNLTWNQVFGDAFSTPMCEQAHVNASTCPRAQMKEREPS
jgi:hypothetical protein